MLLIPKEQALQRWDTLPDNLRDALCAETNSNFIWKTCGDEHIPNEKIYAVARITGYVLMGFLHPDDASKEIQDAIGIDSRIADSIAHSISSRIFTPLRQNIEDTYEPANKSGIKSNMLGGIGGPIMIEEIQKPVRQAQGEPNAVSMPAPQISALPSLSKTPANSMPAAPMPASSITSKNPETQVPSAGSGQVPKPFILQENTLSGQNKKTSDFHVEISDDKLKGLSNVPRPMPIKLAVLELGGNAEKAGSANQISSRPSQGYGGQAGQVQPPKPAGGAKYEGEFSSISPLSKFSKEAPKTAGSFGKNIIEKTPEKNRLVTEITSPFKLSEGKLGGQTIPTPIKSYSEQIAPKTPLSTIPIPPKTPSASSGQAPVVPTSASKPPLPSQPLEKKTAWQVPVPVQIPIEKSGEKIKLNTFFSVPAPASQPMKTPAKPVVIQKNYSEADMPPKSPTAPNLPTTPQAPVPKVPIVPPEKS